MAAVVMDSGRSSKSTVLRNDLLQDIKYRNAEAKLDDNILSSQFVKELENYYNQADKLDKEKCLELITSVGLGEDVKRQMNKLQRSKTAMPVLSNGILKPYQTTYERDYPHKIGRQPWALRPMTSVTYTTAVPDTKVLGPTTYDVEYCEKYQRPPSPERAATSSGQRNNKPHPPQSFLVWKFPSKSKYNKDGDCSVSSELTDEKLSQVTKRLCQSVYQNDYLGIPQGFQVKSAFNLPSNWKENVPYGLESSQRQTYKLPYQQQQLIVPTTRFGSNLLKHIPAVTIIPTANARLVGLNGRTTYDRHYNDRAGLVNEHIKNLEEEALRKYLLKSQHDNEQAGKILEGFEEPQVKSKSHRIAYPMSPASSRSLSAPPTAQRNKFKHSQQSENKLRSLHQVNQAAQSVCSAKSPNISVSPPRGDLPPKYPFKVQLPDTPLSVPYTPPVLLS